MVSAPGRRSEKRKPAFESSRKIISKLFQSFLDQVKIEVTRGQCSNNFQKGFFDDKIFNFKGRATILIPSYLSR